MSSSFKELSISDLTSLAEALKAGRVFSPITRDALRSFCTGSVLDSVLSDLRALEEKGLSLEQIGLFLGLLAEDRNTRSIPEDLIDLVLTGPEAPGTTCRDTGVVVREMFQKAQASVLVAGFAVYQGREVFKTLASNMDANSELKVQIFLDVHRKYKDTTLSSEIIREFAQRFFTKQWPGERLPELYYDPRSLDVEQNKRSALHAKCVVIDGKESFLSSANFTEAAQERNIEVGVLVKSGAIAGKIVLHFRALVERRSLLPIPRI